MLSPFIIPHLPQQQTFILTETQLPKLAKAIIQIVKPHTVISIEGGLGAGKTTLIRAMGEAMAIKTRITSPTYVYFNQYALTASNAITVTQLLHVDFYRLGETEALLQGNNWLVEELLELQAQAPTVILAEWASVVTEAFQPLITHHLQIHNASSLNKEATATTRQYNWFSTERLSL